MPAAGGFDRAKGIGAARISAALPRYRDIAQCIRAFGLACLPACADGSKRPLVKWREFQVRAPTDAEYQDWFARFPNANGVVPCGATHGVFVLDVDTIEAVEYVEKRGLPETPVTRTRRGFHHYFVHPQVFRVRNWIGKIAPGVDVRGDGGLAIAPGSLAKDGFRYSWIPGQSPADLPFAEAPQWLLDILHEVAPEHRPAVARPFAGTVSKYARAALDGELDRVARAANGTRNFTLWCSACALGELVGGGELDEAAVCDSLLDSIAGWESGEQAKARDTICRALAQGKRSPRSAPEKSKTRRPPAQAHVHNHVDDGSLADDRRAKPAEDGSAEGIEVVGDLAVADRILKQHRDVTRWSPATGFLLWDGRRWRQDDREQAERIAEGVVRKLYLEASHEYDPLRQQELVKLARSQSKSNRIEASLKVARRHVAVGVEDLDRDGHLLNVLNGTLDLRNSTLRPHNPANLITKLVPFPYLPSAAAPRFFQFLIEILGGDLGLCEYVKRAIGYSLTAEQWAQCFWVLWGNGDNGKSTLVETLLELFGDYGQAARASLFLADRQQNLNNPDEARLHGVRFAAASETAESARLDEERIKKLTGGEPISASYKYKEPFQFRPSHHLWLSSNHKPVIRGTDHAIWRRIKLIRFQVRFDDPREHPGTEHPKDFLLVEKLRAELPGILAWAVEGAREFYEHGFDEPDCVKVATRDYRAEQDVLQDFIDECCEVDPVYSVVTATLYAAYGEWAKRSGTKPWTKKRFGARLGEKNLFTPTRENNHSWQGLRLRGVV